MPVENKVVLSTSEGGIKRITLNRPEKRNALNDELIAGIKEALREADSDERTRAVVITGSGKDFCSGADLSALERISESSVSENMGDARSLMELFLLIRSRHRRGSRSGAGRWLRTGERLRPRVGKRLRSIWIPRSENWIRAGYGACDFAPQCLGKTRV